MARDDSTSKHSQIDDQANLGAIEWAEVRGHTDLIASTQKASPFWAVSRSLNHDL